MKQPKLSKLTNKQLMMSAIKAIEEETGFHVTDIKIGDTYFFFTSKEKDTICHFHIKELPGFLFAFWNTCRFDKIEDQIKEDHILWSDSYHVNSNSELIFFCQFERYLDKFKPSRSGFLTGIWRQAYYNENEENKKIEKVEEWDMYDLIDILKYMKKNRLKAIFHSCMQNQNIWDEVSYWYVLKDYIKDTYYYYKNKLKKYIKFSYLKYKILKVVKPLKCFDVLLINRENWHPSLHLEVRRRDKVEDTIEYQREYDKLLRLYNSNLYNYISFQWWQIDVDFGVNMDNEEQKEDNNLKKRFYSLCKSCFDKKDLEETESKLLYYNLKDFKIN